MGRDLTISRSDGRDEDIIISFLTSSLCQQLTETSSS